jgi:ribulose 1,5-bisphosphate synthetase/thiazole synthase
MGFGGHSVGDEVFTNAITTAFHQDAFRVSFETSRGVSVSKSAGLARMPPLFCAMLAFRSG